MAVKAKSTQTPTFRAEALKKKVIAVSVRSGFFKNGVHRTTVRSVQLS